MFVYKLQKIGNESLLAVADKNIIGKSFESNDLNIHVSENFYYEKECGEKEILKIINSATIVNAVGNSIIELMLKNMLIEKENIIEIGGVMHAQLVRV